MKLALIGAALALAIPAAARAQDRAPLPVRAIRAEAAATKGTTSKLAPGIPGARTSRTGLVRSIVRPPKAGPPRNERER